MLVYMTKLFYSIYLSLLTVTEGDKKTLHFNVGLKNIMMQTGFRSLTFILMNVLALLLFSVHTIPSYGNQVCKTSKLVCRYETSLSYLMQNVYAKRQVVSVFDFNYRAVCYLVILIQFFFP